MVGKGTATFYVLCFYRFFIMYLPMHFFSIIVIWVLLILFCIAYLLLLLQK